MKYRLAYLSLGEIASYSPNADERQIPKALARDFELTFLNSRAMACPPEILSAASVVPVPCSSAGGIVTRLGRARYVWEAWKRLRRCPVDAFCSSHGMANYVVGLVLSYLVPGKWIVFCWDPPALTFRNRKGLFAKGVVLFTHFFIRACIRRCHRFVLYIHPDLLRAMQVDEATIKSKVLVLPNGVDGAYLEEIGGRSSPDACRVGVVSVASSVKGFEYVIGAFVKAASRDLSLKLSWIGEYTEASKTYAAECARAANVAPERITFTGVLEYGAAMKAAAECGICVFAYQDIPNFRWNYVLKAGEYMALGRCTVAVDLPGVREYVRQDETGILVKPGDEDELAEALVTLAADPEKQDRLGRAAQSFIRGYRWDDITRRMTADLCAVLQRGGSSPCDTSKLSD